MPESQRPRPSRAALVEHLDHVMRLHRERSANPSLAASLARIAAWQARRLRQTYADLAAQPRYAGAIDFFRTDLYGGRDFAQRDADLKRLVPLLSRMMSARVVATVAEAMELNALSQELDHGILLHLPRADRAFTVDEYCMAYRRLGNRAGRERQIELLASIGSALDMIVTKRGIRATLLMMREPARVAGLSALHDFLERGFHAFSRMHGAKAFLATVVERETKLMNEILAGATAPFAVPSRLDVVEGPTTGVGSQ